MALILEVLDGRSAAVRARVRLDTLPFTIGRGYDNDLILDDPYVDARHARIAPNESGVLVVEDLGSRNGLAIADTASAPTDRIAVAAGAQLRVGRTILRFRAPDDPVPPALPHRTQGTGWLHGRMAARWTFPGMLLGGFAAAAWLGWKTSVERSSGTDVFAAGLVFLLFGAFWAGIWAAASRVTIHRFNFVAHFALFGGLILATTAYSIASSWIAFLIPDNPVAAVLGWAVALALFAVMITSHLAYASAMSRARRWRIGLIGCAVVVLIAGFAAVLVDDEFTDVPTFSGVVKPLPEQWLPTLSIDEFGDVSAELKQEVDALSTEESD